MRRLKLLGWRLRNRHFWFLRRKPDNPFITAIIEGRPGEGKTLFMTSMLVDAMRQGYRVATNYTLRDLETGQEAERIHGWLDMLRLSVDALERGDKMVFGIMEIQLWCNSRAFKDTPAWWLALMAQRRHYGISIVGDTQRLKAVEVSLRDIVDECIRVRKSRLMRWFSIPWFWIAKVDPLSIDSDTGYMVGDWERRALPWYAFAYDTHESVKPEPFVSDEATRREIDELTAKLDALVVAGQIPAFVDDHPQYVPVWMDNDPGEAA